MPQSRPVNDRTSDTSAHSGSGLRPEDVTDRSNGAVGRVQRRAEFNELAEVGFENGELLAALADLTKLRLKERTNMGARTLARVADLDDAANLRRRVQTPPFIETHRPGEKTPESANSPPSVVQPYLLTFS